MYRKGTIRIILVCLLLTAALIFPASAETAAEAVFEGKAYPKNAEYIDLGDTVVRDFDALEAFLDQMPALKQVDMWETQIQAEDCDRLAARYPDMKWGWTMVLKGKDHTHLIRTDYTSWSTLHNNTSSHHGSGDFSILKYCWNLMALDIGHNSVTDLDFLYDLPNLRVLIVACNEVTDITPLSRLENLEYAELFKNNITDLSPLEHLEHLLDLNICFNHVENWDALMGLKSLKRLWIYSSQVYNREPPETVVGQLKEALPDTLVDAVHYSTAGKWRFVAENVRHPHYEAIISMFGKDHLHPMYEYVPFDDGLPYTPETGNAAETGAVLTPEPTPEPTPTVDPDAVFRAQSFDDKGYLLPLDFSTGSLPKEAQFTETAYSDSTISVTVEEGVADKCKYWAADVRIQDPSQLRTMAASKNGAFDSTGSLTVGTLAKRLNAVLALNGDYYGSSERRGRGFILRQGTLYRNNLDLPWDGTSSLIDILLVDEDGDFHVCRRASDEAILAEMNGKRILNSFTFGPALVVNGEAVKDFENADRWIDMASKERRQRMCLCQVDTLHYKVICCAGPYRGNTGMTLAEFAELAASLGVRTAYNLDGGDSTCMLFHGQKMNEFGSNSQRKLMDVIYFASAE